MSSAGIRSEALHGRGSPRRRLVYLRDLLRALVTRDITLQYKRSVMGVAWSLLVPLSQLAILTFVFGTVLRIGVPHFSTYLFSGLLPWAWLSASLMRGTLIARQNKDLLHQVGFPAAILPVATVTTQLVNYLVALPILFAFLLIDGRPITPALGAVPLVMTVQFVFILGLVYLLVPLQALFHDTEHLLRIALMLMFYLSPVFYESESVPAAYAFVYHLNPMVHLLDGYRAPLIDGRFPDVVPLLAVALLAALVLMVGYRFFRRMQPRILEEV